MKEHFIVKICLDSQSISLSFKLCLKFVSTARHKCKTQDRDQYTYIFHTNVLWLGEKKKRKRFSIFNTINQSSVALALTYTRLFSAHDKIGMMLRHLGFSFPSILCGPTTSTSRPVRPVLSPRELRVLESNLVPRAFPLKKENLQGKFLKGNPEVEQGSRFVGVA